MIGGSCNAGMLINADVAGKHLNVRQTISAFHQDEASEWVAELSCGHQQHVRHNPPWQERAWVIQDRERSARIGTSIECRLCDEEPE